MKTLSLAAARFAPSTFIDTPSWSLALALPLDLLFILLLIASSLHALS
jgi:hypothetical protein